MTTKRETHHLHDAVIFTAVVQYMRKEDMLHMLCKKIKETTRVVVFDLVRTTSNVDCLNVIYEVLEMV